MGRSVALGGIVADATGLHETRKAAKRTRYVAETLISVFGREAKRLGKAAEGIQVVLGQHQNSVITRAALAEAMRRWLRGVSSPSARRGALGSQATTRLRP